MVLYELIAHEQGFHDKHWSVKILEGEYSGVVYQYDVIKVEEVTEDNGEAVGVLNFSTITIENPYTDEKLKQKEFEIIIGEILTELIKQWAENKDAQDGNSDTEELAE